MAADPTLVAARKLRAYEEEHPLQAIVGGFTPGIGQASSAAALRDPDAPWWEKALSVPGLVPGIGGAAKAIVIGAKLGKGNKALEESLAQARKMAAEHSPSSASNPVTKGPKGTKGLLEGDPRINDRIHKETGWWKDPDSGQWKTELDDSRAAPDFEFMDQVSANNRNIEDIADMGPIGDSFPHPELMALPEGRKLLAEVKLERNPGAVGRGGEFDPNSDIVRFGEKILPADSSMGRIRQVLLHEKQHAIQKKEMFLGRGTNPEAAGSFEAYLKDIGEIEARLVDQRRNMTPQARRKFPFHRHLDVERARLMDPTEASRVAGRDDLVRALKLRNLDPEEMILPGQ